MTTATRAKTMWTIDGYLCDGKHVINYAYDLGFRGPDYVAFRAAAFLVNLGFKVRSVDPTQGNVYGPEAGTIGNPPHTL
jgi:hypothetical protein